MSRVPDTSERLISDDLRERVAQTLYSMSPATDTRTGNAVPWEELPLGARVKARWMAGQFAGIFRDLMAEYSNTSAIQSEAPQ